MLTDRLKDLMAEMCWSKQDVVDFAVEFIWRNYSLDKLARFAYESKEDKLEATLIFFKEIRRLDDFEKELLNLASIIKRGNGSIPDLIMKMKGYNYHLTPTDNSFEPLYVKNEENVADLFRSYKANIFTVRKL